MSGRTAIGGHFSSIFDNKDYLAMINIPDEAACVLRGHLILEEVLNLWSRKITSVDDLYKGMFFSFKSKLVISENLGFDKDHCTAFNKINDIRNKFSHRKGFELEKSQVESLAKIVDGISSKNVVQKCHTFEMVVGGQTVEGELREVKLNWEASNNRMKFVLVFVILMLKLTEWIQKELNVRGIRFTIVAD